MVRLGRIFVALCIGLIAASIGAVGYLYFGLPGADAIILALAVFVGLALYNVFTSRSRERGDVGTQIADLSRGGADLARQVAEMGRRVAALEGKIENSLSKARSSIADPLAHEIGELGTLVKQLAETVAAHETAIQNGVARPAPAPAVAAPPPLPPLGAAPMPSLAVTELPAALRLVPPAEDDEAAEARAVDNPAMIDTVRKAVEAGRIDLYLQPIVTLPQRKVRYYEALSRLRAENGDIVVAADFLDYAEAAGVMGRIDNLALFRAVQVVRRLMMKNRDIGMFCNMAGSTLADAGFFPQLSEFIEANKALASALVLEFSQRAVRALGPMEQESLAALAERGFRFSMDQVTDLRFEPRELSERGFRFVKAPASLLLHQGHAADMDIHPADLSDLLGRHGIELIASRIESEGSVVDLLDFDVRYGQGFLFSPPRPVRQEALRGAPDRGQGVAEDRELGDDRPPSRIAERAGGLGKLARSALGSA
jgi:cyclic-di-GMP phosphodiesterase TipF (flagellum assembly factor)